MEPQPIDDRRDDRRRLDDRRDRIVAAGPLVERLAQEPLEEAPNNEWWLWEPYIGIETALNPGALFGMGGGWGKFFAVLSFGAALGIPVWLFVYRAATSLRLTVSLSCIMGGILGNLYDRLGLWHEP